MFFFSHVTFYGLPVTLFEKMPVILKKCPWQKTPNFARENWLVTRDKKAKKMPVKNDKWPWQFLQICKSARDNFWFLAVTKQKVPVTNQFIFLRNFKSPVKVTGFFFFSAKSSLVIHSKPGNFAFLKLWDTWGLCSGEKTAPQRPGKKSERPGKINARNEPV